MPAGVYLLAGEPGMGKSTLALQLIHDMTRKTPNLDRAYYTGEETAQQVQSRFSRLYPEHRSPVQVRSCSELLTDLAKQYGVTMLIIGHVTKGGEIAGPKYLEHIVDVVLYLE